MEIKISAKNKNFSVYSKVKIKKRAFRTSCSESSKHFSIKFKAYFLKRYSYKNAKLGV